MWYYIMLIFDLVTSEICTDDLKLPEIERRTNKNYKIDCELKANQPYAMIPWKKCKDTEKCLLSNEGAIRIDNCMPDENTTITDMLMSFNRTGSNQKLIAPDNLTHLIIGADVKIYKKSTQTSLSVAVNRNGKLKYLKRRV